MNESGSLNFSDVIEAERAAGLPGEGKAVGLAFSGGGIRSATFNLGVIQALAERGLLQRFDYLSTISGGGYIGSWLSLFIKRNAGGDVKKAEELLARRDKNGLEHRAIRFLRSFSNYLTPHVGLSRDTLVAVATYLRNLLLNLAILITLLGALLILPRIIGLGAESITGWVFDSWQDFTAIALLVVPTLTVALCLLHEPGPRVERPWFMGGRMLVLLIDVPVLAAACVTAVFYLNVAGDGHLDSGGWFVAVMFAYVLLWLIGILVAIAVLPEARDQAKQLMSRAHAKWHLAFIAFAIVAGATGSVLLLALARGIAAIPEPHRLWLAVTFGPPAVIGAIMLMVVVHVGFMGRWFGEADRELWSAFGARMLVLVIGWAGFFLIALYGAAALRWANDWIVGLGGMAWVLSTLFGVFAGKSQATGKNDSPKAMELLTRVAPCVFVLGLLLALSWGLHRTLEWADVLRGGPKSEATASTALPGLAEGLYLRAEATPGTPLVTVHGIDRPDSWAQFLAIAKKEYASIERWKTPAWALPLMLAGGLLLSLLISWRVNINLFSLHHFYRNRLVRCYLGATNEQRRPHPLTGFDPEDDLPFADLSAPRADGRIQRPMHIVGTAINLNRGRQLAWQSRRAASFAFTPLHAGYEPASTQVSGGFREIGAYGMDAEGQAITLGAAVAISGAAASPNMGYHTSPAVAFLMTVFNVRLGHWCGDTGHRKAWRRRDPELALRYWLAEITGTADQDYPFVSLSDGGHFENLGIYELVRRRCAAIVASDAGCDPKYAFEDLAGAMRKCYTDFGVRIEFRAQYPAEDIRPENRRKLSARHFAIADIVYSEDSRQTGTLIYLKSSLSAGLPPDITNYRRTRKDFPHETTADQFFDEAQFESYRHLGYEVAKRSIDELSDAGQLPPVLQPSSGPRG